MISMRRLSSSTRSFGSNGSSRTCSTTGWRPRSMWMPGVVDERGRVPVERLGALGEVREHVELGDAAAAAFSGARRSMQEVEQRVVQRALAHQRALARRQHLVLELLQLLGDVALGALDRLPARVVRRRLVGLRLADLDVVAVHAVVADLQRRDAGRGFLALFEVDQELVGVAWTARAVRRVRRRSRRANTPPSRCSAGGCVDDGACEMRGGVGVVADAFDQMLCSSGLSQRRRCSFAQAPARAARPSRKRRQIARARRAQRDAREDAFEIADAAQDARAALRSGARRSACRSPDARRRSDVRDRAAADAASGAAGARPSA